MKIHLNDGNEGSPPSLALICFAIFDRTLGDDVPGNRNLFLVTIRRETYYAGIQSRRWCAGKLHLHFQHQHSPLLIIRDVVMSFPDISLMNGMI